MEVDIVEDARANKVSVEVQFQRYLDAGALEGQPKKAKMAQTPENVVELVSTPPPPIPDNHSRGTSTSTAGRQSPGGISTCHPGGTQIQGRPGC